MGHCRTINDSPILFEVVKLSRAKLVDLPLGENCISIKKEGTALSAGYLLLGLRDHDLSTQPLQLQYGSASESVITVVISTSASGTTLQPPCI